VQSMGWRLVAASGDIDLKALKDNINLLAKLKVSVTAERITLSAKEEVVIQAGGSSTTYNASGIVHATAGEYTAHATDFIYKGSKSQAAAFPEDLKTGTGNLELLQQYANAMPFKKGQYEVEDALGEVFKGALDGDGKASIAGLAPGPVKVRFSDDDVDVWHDPGFPGPHEQISGELSLRSPAELSEQAGAILKQLASSPTAQGLKSGTHQVGSKKLTDVAKGVLERTGVPETLSKLSEKAR